MSNTPGPNPNVPSIQTPVADPRSLVNSVQSLKQGMESLGGTRGSPLDRAVTYNDLINLGLAKATATTFGNNPIAGVVVLADNWDTTAVTALGAGLAISSGTISALWQAGVVTALSGASIISGTLTVTGGSGLTHPQVMARLDMGF